MAGEVEAEIARILVTSIVPGTDPAKVTPDTPLIEGGLGLDSVNLLELIVAIEEHFGITIEDEDLSIALIATVGSLAGYVRGKLASSGPALKA